MPIQSFVSATLVILLSTFVTERASAAANLEDKPRQVNVVLIMADDISQDMYGCYGNETAKTPHLDRMARQGVRFVTAWATPMCSPTRAMIMTGRYAYRTGYYHNGLKIPPDGGAANLVAKNLTFGKLLKDAGYATAIAGKWHVTGDAPHTKHGGFDEHSLWVGQKELDLLPGKPKFKGLYENDTTPSRYWNPCIVQNHKLLDTKPEDFGTTIHTDFLCDFIERNRERPFLAYFSLSAPHGTRKGHTTNPLRGEVGDIEPLTKEEGAARFASLNEYIDLCVGRLVKQVEELGLLENTVIIYTSDNGTASTAKSRAVERGARVPLIIYGGTIKQRGSSLELTDLTDILPTLLDYAGAKLPRGYKVDGHTLVPYLSGEADTHTRQWIYSYIAASQMMRDRRWLLEAVCPMLDSTKGRFYDTRGNREGKGYRDVSDSKDPAVLAARKRFDEVLAAHGTLTRNHPYWITRKGAKFLRAYEEPGAKQKHLSQHRDYQYELIDRAGDAAERPDSPPRKRNARKRKP